MYLAALIAAASASSDSAAPVEARRFEAETVLPNVPAEKPLRVLALVQARAAATDIVSTNPFLDGQVLGTLGGTNGMEVDPDARSYYVEQRASGFFTWKPDVLDGKAGLTAAFEIDFGWGDRSYGIGGNTGGGFGGDQVNLQTRRLHFDVWQKLSAQHRLHLVVGLQFLADSASDPTATTPDGLFRSGGRLLFFGSEAAGLSAYGSIRTGFGERLRYRLGTYTLLELGLGEPDDAWLNMADVTWVPSRGLEVGAHAWLLRDNTGGTGGALGAGPTSPLSEMQGGPRLDPYGDTPRPDEDAGTNALLVWTALDLGFNPGLTQGPFGFTALAVLNAGSLKANQGPTVPLLGQLFDVEARLRWWRGKGSVVRAEALYSSPDDGDTTNRHTGVVTGNSYGFVGAIHNTHGMRLLFTDPQSINRMVAVVYDASGGERGVLGITSTAGLDVIPNKVNAEVGFGTALAPQRGTYGTEINAQLSHEPWPFFTYYVAGATLFPGDQALVSDTAWVGYAGVEWLAF
ncbi:MAG: hypothetical protein H6737_11565 [Alphaproteobacteria bacterium]|nr:hypothetical protein [Alphaproteobacteria bacterium]